MNREITVDRGEIRQFLRRDAFQPHSKAWQALCGDELFIAGTAFDGFEPPSPQEGGAIIEPLCDVRYGQALDDPGSPERWRGYVNAAFHILRTPGVDLTPLCHLGLLVAAFLGFGEFRPRDALLDRHDCIHQGQPFEGVLGVAHLALEHVVQVMLHEGPGQGGSPQHHRVFLRQPQTVQLGEVVLHHKRGLHQQPRHADGVSPVRLSGVDDGLDRLLDPDVDDGVTIVADDDVDEVLTDVMDITPDSSEHEGALAAAALHLVDVRFQVCHRGLHHLGGLKDERQLHLAGAEELTDHLHARQQVLVDDVESRLPRQGLVEVRLKPLGLAVDDAAS